MTKTLSLLQALVEVTNNWYSDWHHNAEEGELPPEHMQAIISYLVARDFAKNLNIPSDLIQDYGVFYD